VDSKFNILKLKCSYEKASLKKDESRVGNRGVGVDLH